MAVSWSSDVNTDAYGMTTGARPNVKKIEFESGKSRSFNLNSSPKMIHSFNIDLRTDAERAAFWTWWADRLRSGAESFWFPNLMARGGMTEYEMTSEPSEQGQSPRVLTIEVAEV